MKPGRPPGKRVDFVRRLMRASGLTAAEINGVLSVLEDVLRADLGAGIPVTIPGICRIRVGTTAARPGRLWQRPGGAVTELPARPAVRVVRIRPHADLVKRIESL